jgi:cobalt/nickel transport system permease protein
MKYMIQELYALEQLSNGGTCVHRLHPLAKLSVTFFFIVTVISFDRYAFGRLTPYVFYPTIMTALSGTPYSMLLKRVLIVLPFCLFAGVANTVFDRVPAFTIGAVTVSYGTVSMFVILFKMYLCVMAVLLLVSVTPLAEITGAMRRLRLPGVFVTVFEMTCRYTGVLFAEAYSMYAAYTLRSAGRKGVAIRDMGSFVGQLLLRSIDRAERVYNAMKCRGYALRTVRQTGRKFKLQDIFFCAVTCFLCVVFRVVNLMNRF